MNHPAPPAPEASPGKPVRSLAYLVSRYPTLSMIFVLREVVALRSMGFRIETASINPPDRPADRLTAQEREEAARTYCVKGHGIPGAIAAHLKTLVQNPGGYLHGFWLVFALGKLDLGRLFLNFMYFSEGLMVGQWMRRMHLRHLHVHLASQAASVGLFTQRVFRVGYSLTVHGPDEFYDAKGQYLAQKIAAAQFIACISSYTRSQLMNLSPSSDWSKFHVSRLGIDPHLFSPLPRNPLDDPFEILCVGRLTPAKGLHLLIDAVEQLVQQGRRVRLRLVGNGPDEDSLQKRAEASPVRDSILFEGAVNQDLIRTFYALAHVFCLPSFAEGLPVVLMEAMAMGIPCVSTQITGIPELIRDGTDGLLVPASDVDALVQALGTLMDDPALRQRLAAKGREQVLEHYDLHRNIEMLAEIFIAQVRD